jgi:hypothetical protein
VAAAVLAACGGGQSGNEGAEDERLQFEEIVADQPLTGAQMSLCELVRHPMFGQSGLYEVVSMSGATEEDLYNPGSMAGFTYVHLSRVVAFEATSADPTARILGGPWPDGTIGGWRISLSVGEQLGLLLVEPTPENRDFYDLHELGTFKEREDGGFSNGQLFQSRRVNAQELRDLIMGLSQLQPGQPCPYDEQPSVGNADTSGDSEVDVQP